MDVFISWSGQRSQAVAQALHGWLPMVIQSIRPWMSSSDIESGARWSQELAAHLKECKVGVICLTPDNLTAPYLMFEAGALSKTVVEATCVIPYLFQLDISDVQGPLAEFQARKANQPDTKMIIETVNRACGAGALPAAQLDKAFEVWWPQLEKSLQGIPEAQQQRSPRRTQEEILEEILSAVRSQSQQITALAQNSILSTPLSGISGGGGGGSVLPRYTYTISGLDKSPGQMPIIDLGRLGTVRLQGDLPELLKPPTEPLFKLVLDDKPEGLDLANPPP